MKQVCLRLASSHLKGITVEPQHRETTVLHYSYINRDDNCHSEQQMGPAIVVVYIAKMNNWFAKSFLSGRKYRFSQCHVRIYRRQAMVLNNVLKISHAIKKNAWRNLPWSSSSDIQGAPILTFYQERGFSSSLWETFTFKVSMEQSFISSCCVRNRYCWIFQKVTF